MLYGILQDVLAAGRPAEARGRKFLDYSGWSGVLSNPRAREIWNPVRGIRRGYNAASVAWNLAERNDVESICWWNPNGRKISDNGLTFYGANYGQRWNPYLDEAIDLLRSDPGTRRAFVPIWKPDDLMKETVTTLGHQAPVRERYSRVGKDVPCTLGFGLKIRKTQPLPVSMPEARAPWLDMQVIMRSNSAFFVFPYDIYLFSVLQELIANEMGLLLGELSWMAMSMHVYEDELAIVTDALKWYSENDVEHDPMPEIPTTLHNARVLYPEAFERFMKDQSPPIYEFPTDPVILEMFEGAREIADAKTA